MYVMQKPAYHIGIKAEPNTARDLHILNVYEDPAFALDVARIVPDKNKLKAMEEAVYGYTEALSPDYKNALTLIDVKIAKQLANKYCISTDDIIFYLLGGHEAFGTIALAKPPFVLKRFDEGKFQAEFNEDITKSDIITMWEFVSNYRKEKYGSKEPQRKPPLNDKLLYAIFKARQQTPKPTFLQLFWRYQEGKLEGYGQENGHDRKQFKDYKSMQTYYNRHKPKVSS